jgi:hypothetical protein
VRQSETRMKTRFGLRFVIYGYVFRTLSRELGKLKKVQKIVKNLLAKIKSETLQCVKGYILCQRTKSAPTTHLGNYYEAHSSRKIE